MLLLDSVVPEKWYSVRDAGAILGYAHDTVEDLIRDEFLQALLKPQKRSRGQGFYICKSVQGCEIIRFVKDNLSVQEPRKMVRRMRR